MSPQHLLRRSLSILVLASMAVGCHITVHNHGGTSPKGGKGGSGETSGGGSKGDKPDKPKGDKPKSDKPDKPSKDKPKGDKPKGDKPKGDKPDKPKDDKPGTDKPGDKPKDPKPPAGDKDPPKPAEPLPPDGMSRLSVPLRAPFEELVERVDALLPKTQSQDWQRMGKDGDSTVLDVKYKMWRDPIEAKFKGRTLTIVVPVRYAADIKGKVKNPFGSDYLPLNNGQTWGTKSSPQRLRLTVDLELDVNDEWKLVTQAKLEQVEHGPAPKGNFCAHAGIDFCTPKENMAGEVHKNIERYLSPRIMKELEKAERELQKNLDLRAQAGALWAGVQKPLQLQKVGDKSCPTAPLSSCKEAAWLVFEPKTFGLSELSLVDGDLGIDVGLEGKLRVVTGKKPKAGAEKLPKPGKLPGATAFQLKIVLDVPASALAKEIKAALAGQAFGKDGARLDIVNVDLKAKNGRDLTLTLETKGAHAGRLGVSGRLVLDEKKGELGIEQVTFDAEAKKLFDKELKGVDQKQLATSIEKAARVAIGKESKVLRRAITQALDGALPGQLEVKGTLDDVAFRSVDVTGDVLRLEAELSGSLGLEYSL